MKVEKYEVVKLSESEMEVINEAIDLLSSMGIAVTDKEARQTFVNACHALNCAKYFIKEED